MRHQVEAWSHGVRTLGKKSKRHSQSAYASLVVLLQLMCQYLKNTVPIVGTIMVPIEEDLRETLFTTPFVGE